MGRRWPNPVTAPRGVSSGRDPNQRLIGNRKNRGSGTAVLDIDITGVNVLADHFYAVAAIFDEAATGVLDVCADIGIGEARRLVHKRTWATHDSINKEPGVWGHPERGEWSIRFGPTTFYSPFLEYGTIHAPPYPFMGPAGDMAEVAFYATIIGMIKLLDSNSAGTGFGSFGGGKGAPVLNDPRVHSIFGKYRSFLYSTAKALGDVSVFGGRGFLGPIRAQMYGLARLLGDVQAGMTGTIRTRVVNRLHGRVTGRIIGFGSASLSHSASYSAFVGGAGGHRIYQRVAGRFGSGGFNPQTLIGRILPP